MAFDPASATVRGLAQSVRQAVGSNRMQSAGVYAPVETVPGIGAGLRLAGKPGEVNGFLSAQTLLASWRARPARRRSTTLLASRVRAPAAALGAKSEAVAPG